MASVNTVSKTSRLWEVVLFFLVIIIIAVFVSPYLLDQTNNFNADQCQLNIMRIANSLNMYCQANNSLPMSNSASLKPPPYSWRIAILPYDTFGVNLANSYRFDELWNSAHNTTLHSLSTPFFHCERDQSPKTDTSYVTIQGPSTFFPDQEVVKLSGFQDGFTNSILAVETHQSGIHWMEPRDLRIEDAVKGLNRPGSLSISSNHKYFSDRKRDGAFVSFADSRVQFLNSNIDPKLLRSLLEIDNPDKPKEKYISP